MDTHHRPATSKLRHCPPSGISADGEPALPITVTSSQRPPTSSEAGRAAWLVDGGQHRSAALARQPAGASRGWRGTVVGARAGPRERRGARRSAGAITFRAAPSRPARSGPWRRAPGGRRACRRRPASCCSRTALSKVGRGIVVDHAERHREGADRHVDQHVRDRLVRGIVDDDVGRLPVAVGDVDDLEVERLAVERQALGAVVEQHRLAGLQPELLAAYCPWR